MPFNPARVPIWKAMLAVAVIAVALAVHRLAGELRFWTLSHGWNTSVLRVGEPVVLVREIRDGPRVVPANTPGIVVSDPPDEDSAYPDRAVRVLISAGRQRGSVIEAERTWLRVRPAP